MYFYVLERILLKLSTTAYSRFMKWGHGSSGDTAEVGTRLKWGHGGDRSRGVLHNVESTVS